MKVQERKVACIGNMNNMLFSVARYLRDNGVDAHLFLAANELNGLEHFLPENDTFDSTYKDFTHYLSWGAGGSNVFKKTTKEKIRSDLKEFNFFIVCGTSLAYLNKAGIKADIFLPHGSDLKYVPFMNEKMNWINKIRNPYGYKFFLSMRKGIRESKIINVEHSDPFWKDPLVRLGVLSKSTYFGCPMIYEPIYRRGQIEKIYDKIPNIDLYKKLRNENQLLIVNQATQTWAAPYDQNGRPSKGSDKLIRGFSDFIKEKPFYKAKLVLFEYGNDVILSKELIADLGIEEFVFWHPIASRKEIMVLLSMADFGCGEFEPGCIGGNTTWEALVSGSCLLHYLNTEYTKFDSFLDTPYPFVNVKSSFEICNVFNQFYNSPERFKALGIEGNKWYKKYFSEKSVNEWLGCIYGN